MKEILKKIGLFIFFPFLDALLNIPLIFLVIAQKKLDDINYFLGLIFFFFFGFVFLKVFWNIIINPIIIFLYILFSDFKQVFLNSFYYYLAVVSYVVTNLISLSIVAALLAKNGYREAAKTFIRVSIFFEKTNWLFIAINLFLISLFIVRIFHFIGCKILQEKKE